MALDNEKLQEVKLLELLIEQVRKENTLYNSATMRFDSVHIATYSFHGVDKAHSELERLWLFGQGELLEKKYLYGTVPPYEVPEANDHTVSSSYKIPKRRYQEILQKYKVTSDALRYLINKLTDVQM